MTNEIVTVLNDSSICLSVDCFSEADALEEGVSRASVIVLIHKVGKVFGILLCEDCEASLDGLKVNVKPAAHAMLGFGAILFDFEIAILDEGAVTEEGRLLAVFGFTNTLGLFNPVTRPALEGTGQKVFYPLHSNVVGHHQRDKSISVFHMFIGFGMRDGP